MFPNRIVPLVVLLGICWAARWLLWPLALYYFARSARLLVWWLFREKTAPDLYDPAVMRVKRLRTWAALATSIAAAGFYTSFGDFVADKILVLLQTLLLTTWLFAAGAAVAVAILIRCAPRGERRGLPDNAAEAVLGWLILVSLLASTMAVQTGFGLATVHPALPALVTGILVWELFAINGVSDGLPPAIAYPMSLGGPITVYRHRVVGDPPVAHRARGDPPRRPGGHPRSDVVFNRGDALISASVNLSVTHPPRANSLVWSAWCGDVGSADREYVTTVRARGPSGVSSTAIRKLEPVSTSG